jgi:hypothetical protein
MKELQLESWISRQVPSMVTIRIIECGYKHPSIKSLLHHKLFRSFVALHQKFNQLACNGKHGIN